jgi:SnoaL-like domain
MGCGPDEHHFTSLRRARPARQRKKPPRILQTNDGESEFRDDFLPSGEERQMAGTDEDELQERLSRLEARVHSLEDQLAIYQLLARYAPSVDSRSETSTASMWTEDGQYDYGDTPLVGAAAVGALVNNERHTGYVARGCAHVISMPLVHVDGDRAVATGYSRLYVKEGDGWKVERASANRWELVRSETGWSVQNRVNRMLDGSSDGRELLKRGVTEAS